MPPQIATAAYLTLILGLFWLDRDRKNPASKALWIPLLWLVINGSRPVSEWFDSGPTIDSAEKHLDGSPLDAVIFGMLLLAGLMVLAGRQKRVRAILTANAPIILFLTYCLLSVVWSDYSFVAFKRWTKEVGDVVMVMVVLTESVPAAALHWVLARTGFLLVPLSVLCIKYYPDFGRSYNIWTWTPMYGGVTTNKNLLGMLCLVYGLVSLWCLLSAWKDGEGIQRKRQLIAHGIVLSMVCWLLWMCNSMTSISCLTMAGGLMAMAKLTRFGRKPAMVNLGILASLAVASSVIFLGAGGGALQTMGRDATLTGRTAIWSIVLNVAGNPLIGSGFESFWLGDRLEKVWEGFGLHINEAHNGYLEVYVNLGWIGLALLAVLIAAAYKNVMRGLREDRDESFLKLAFFVVAIVYNFTEAGFRMMTPVWTGFLLAALTWPQSASPEPAHNFAPEPVDGYEDFEPVASHSFDDYSDGETY